MPIIRFSHSTRLSATFEYLAPSKFVGLPKEEDPDSITGSLPPAAALTECAQRKLYQHT